MSTGRKNKLVGQAGEYLVCAQLAKRGYMATPFAGNVPVFDVLIADARCRTLAIQVKTASGLQWPTDARLWLRLDFNAETEQQVSKGPLELGMPDLITVCVALDVVGTKDRFFILTARELQVGIVKGYSSWMTQRGWKRPKSPQSFDCRYGLTELAEFEDRWSLISDRLNCLSGGLSDPSPAAVAVVEDP